MSNPAMARRRWFGLFYLGLAAGMLIWGQTVLKSALDGLVFMIYWTAVFVLTVMAMVTALLDIRAVRRQARSERRDLLKESITQAESQQKPPRG